MLVGFGGDEEGGEGGEEGFDVVVGFGGGGTYVVVGLGGTSAVVVGLGGTGVGVLVGQGVDEGQGGHCWHGFEGGHDGSGFHQLAFAPASVAAVSSRFQPLPFPPSSGHLHWPSPPLPQPKVRL